MIGHSVAASSSYHLHGAHAHAVSHHSGWCVGGGQGQGQGQGGAGAGGGDGEGQWQWQEGSQ